MDRTSLARQMDRVSLARKMIRKNGFYYSFSTVEQSLSYMSVTLSMK